MIDAKIGNVATVDIPGAFRHTNTECDNVCIKGGMADILVKRDPKLYRKYIHSANGKTMMHIQLKKSLYNTFYAAMLF